MWNMSKRSREQAGSDGISWYCKSCKTTKSRYNSLFSKSNLTLKQLIVWWAKQYSVLRAANEADVSENSAC